MRMIVSGRVLGLKAQTTGFGCGNPEKSFSQRRKRQQRLILCYFAPLREILEVQLKSKLELPWVEGGSRSAVIAAIVGALVERPHVIDERRRRSLVEAVEEIKAFRNQFQPETLADRHQSRQPQIQ